MALFFCVWPAIAAWLSSSVDLNFWIWKAFFDDATAGGEPVCWGGEEEAHAAEGDVDADADAAEDGDTDAAGGNASLGGGVPGGPEGTGTEGKSCWMILVAWAWSEEERKKKKTRQNKQNKDEWKLNRRMLNRN